MDIHAPEGPARSLKEFAIHILIVTIGILIALGLEGIRETVHEHHLIAETRETFRQELGGDRDNLVLETANVGEMRPKVDAMLRDFSELVKNPSSLQKRFDDLQPNFYFFRGTAWGGASSSGVLAYMKPEEVNNFADIYFGIQTYQTNSRQTQLDWVATKSFFDSRQSFTAQDVAEGELRLRTFQLDLRAMAHLDQEFMQGLNRVLGPQ
ncbi:MAG TPA: hypothetical protein VGU46_09405 [Acidobacteriaceae bacterium]|nr:hypothetical protein [Acidobacteriaceae bacterium]